MVLLLLECLVNHTAHVTRRKSRDNEALYSHRINLFQAIGYLKELPVIEEGEHTATDAAIAGQGSKYLK
jgi:hypothetical protein